MWDVEGSVGKGRGWVRKGRGGCKWDESGRW